MQDLRCNIPGHNKKKFVSVQLSNQADKRLFCFQCVNDIPMANSLTQSQVSAQQLCDLEEVMDSNQYNVFNWPIDPVGRKVKDMLLQFKTPEQQKKEIEDFFLQMRTKITESVDQIKTLLIDTINITLGVEVKDAKVQQEPAKDQKKDDKKDDKKEAKKDDKKEAKKDDKKEAKKDDKKDDKKEGKKDDKKEAKKEDKKEDKKEELDAPTIQNLKKLYDQVYDLTRIRQLIKDNAKNADPDVLSQKIGDALNDAKRNEQFGLMKEMFAKLSSNPKKAEINTGGEQIQGFQQRVLESLTSWSQFFGVISWKFQASQAEESNKIKTITQGIEIQGGGGQQQIIYSSEAFTAGQHGCLYKNIQNGSSLLLWNFSAKYSESSIKNTRSWRNYHYQNRITILNDQHTKNHLHGRTEERRKWAIQKVPGPGEYRGIQNAVKRRQPEYSFGGRFAPVEQLNQTPGPGAYDPDCRQLLKSASSFTMRPKTRNEFITNTGPGPAAYETNYSTLYRPSSRIGNQNRGVYNYSDVPGVGVYDIRPSTSGPFHKFGDSLRDANFEREITPGPGAYMHQSQLKLQAKTMSSKRLQTNTTAQPGPGQYDPLVDQTKRSQPFIRVGTAQQRPQWGRAQTPGPGAYQPTASDKRRPPSYKMGLETRKILDQQEVPGPGTYDIGRELGSKSYTLRPKFTDRIQDSTPGPLDYHPSVEYTKLRPTSCRVGTGQRVTTRPDNNPAPGQYEAYGNNNGPKYPFGTQSKIDEKTNEGPGPGSYTLPVYFANLPHYAIAK